MKRIIIPIITLVTFMITSCGNTQNTQILGKYELNKTEYSDISKEFDSLENDKVWNEKKQIYEYSPVVYADYSLNDMDGRICFTINDNKVTKIVFVTSSDNSNKIAEYVTSEYGTEYKNIDDSTTEWNSANYTIDTVINNEEIRITWE